MMDQGAIAEAVKQICDEKGISFESVLETINAALAAAYRKDFGEKNQNIEVDFDLETGQIKVFDIKTVVEDVPEEELAAQQAEAEAEAEAKASREPKPLKKEDVPAEKKTKSETDSDETEDEEEERRFNPKTDLQISDAKKLKKTAKLGDVIKTDLELPGDFGRMAAQTAKQVITQKLRETERATLYEEYKDREGEIIVGTVQRREGRTVLIDLGRMTAVLPGDEQINDENYTPGGSFKFYIVSVASTTKGPEIILSRSHPDIVRKLFTLEIPEIANGTVEIKGIAREAGHRSKVAVWTDEENIDPIGSCIGQRGARIQTIISELKGEKVDIIKWSEDPVEFIANALSPAKIEKITLNEDEKTATAQVDETQLSLAIGKAGQNVRLAAKLSGWRIDVVTDGQSKAKGDDGEETTTESEAETTEKTDNEAQEPAEAEPAEAAKEITEADEATPEEPEQTPGEKDEAKKTKK